VTVVLNEVGLAELFRGQEMQRFLERRVFAVEEQARANASGPILGIDTGDLLENLSSHSEVREGVAVGIVGTDASHGVPSFNYPAYWDESGKPWLFSALQQFFPDARRT